MSFKRDDISYLQETNVITKRVDFYQILRAKDK